MSGGSFNYLCHKNASDLFSDEMLGEMLTELESLGYLAKGPAERTRRLVEIRDLVDQEIQVLAPVWRAVEWWRSCDWGEDQVYAELGAWRERHKERSA